MQDKRILGIQYLKLVVSHKHFFLEKYPYYNTKFLSFLLKYSFCFLFEVLAVLVKNHNQGITCVVRIVQVLYIYELKLYLKLKNCCNTAVELFLL